MAKLGTHTGGKTQSAWTKNPLIISLDVDSKLEAEKLANELGAAAGCYKLGPRLVYRFGDEIVRKISQIAPVFIDCKFFDIPSTMLAAVQACFDSGASLVTVHALSGSEALQELAQLERKLNAIRPFKILCVTVLTSWSSKQVPTVMKPLPIINLVEEMSAMVENAGLTGLVCSAEELNTVASKKFFTVVPGIRLAHHSHGDQKRVMTPQQAIKLGASALVVGRPIITAQNPAQEAEKYLADISAN